MTNRDLAEYIFDVIGKMGYQPYDIHYDSGYFLFDMGEDSVVHFKLHGLGVLGRMWKFGMWINAEHLDKQNRDEYIEKYPNTREEDLNVMSIFAQYKTQIDKFKPSRSSLCIEYDGEEWNRCTNGAYKYPWNQLESMLGMMKKHPFLCYDDYCGEHVGYANHSFVTEFLDNECRYYYRRIKKIIFKTFYRSYFSFLVYLKSKSKIVSSITMYDFEKENPGFSTGYLYQVRIMFKSGVTNEQMLKFLGRWADKFEYGEYSKYRCVVEIGVLRQEGVEKSFRFEK